MQGEEERIPFEELGEHEWTYLKLCRIETRKEYEEAGWLITRPREGEQ